MEEIVPLPAGKGSAVGRHSLQATWVFWYLIPNKTSLQSDWSEYLHPLHSFDTLEGFSLITNSIAKPAVLFKGCRYYVFREQTRPVWEEPSMQNGVILCCEIPKTEDRAEYIGTRWIDLVYFAIGGNFHEEDEVAGIEFNSHPNSWKVSLWLYHPVASMEEIETKMKELFQCERVTIDEIGKLDAEA